MFKEFLLDEQGDMIERGLIAAAIALVGVTVWFALGHKLAGVVTAVENAIP